MSYRAAEMHVQAAGSAALPGVPVTCLVPVASYGAAKG